MLVIGHRGAAGLAPENSMKAFQAGFASGADMLELDVRLTRDGVPIVIHDARLLRTHHHAESVHNLTLLEIQSLTVAQPIPTLADVLDAYYGKILLNIELKSRGSAASVYRLIKKHYIKKKKDWENILISSFYARELNQLRKLSPDINLALLHSNNPFLFIAYQRRLHLTAVGFHRLYRHPLALEIARRAHLFIYVYTVNRPASFSLLEEQGVDGVVTNYPDKFVALRDKRR